MTNYVADTSSLVSYFSKELNARCTISKNGLNLISQALFTFPTNVKLSIPSIVFVEMFDKWFGEEEKASQIRYNILEPINKSPNIEIKELDKEVMENILLIGDELNRHEINDKIILACAMMLKCPLITSDRAIIKYLNKHRTISYIS